MSEIERAMELGRLTARIETLERELSETRAMVKEVRDIMLQAKGSWRAMVVVGSVAAATGALATKVLGVIWR